MEIELKKWDDNEASEGELEVSRAINKVAGYA